MNLHDIAHPDDEAARRVEANLRDPHKGGWPRALARRNTRTGTRSAPEYPIEVLLYPEAGWAAWSRSDTDYWTARA